MRQWAPSLPLRARRGKLDHQLDGEAVRQHDRFGATLAACGEQFGAGRAWDRACGRALLSRRSFLADVCEISILFFLYAIKVINNCKNSAPDYWFAIVERVNKVRGYGIDPWNWCWRIPEAPNGHIASTVGLNLLSPDVRLLSPRLLSPSLHIKSNDQIDNH
jgi:hypothetical protein